MRVICGLIECYSDELDREFRDYPMSYSEYEHERLRRFKKLAKKMGIAGAAGLVAGAALGGKLGYSLGKGRSKVKDV